MPTEIVRSGTLTLNVDDNTVSKGTVKVTTSLESIRENSRTRSVVVTAELSSSIWIQGTTVMVTVDVTGGDDTEASSDSNSGPVQTSGSKATVEITPVNDDCLFDQVIHSDGSFHWLSQWHGDD